VAATATAAATPIAAASATIGALAAGTTPTSAAAAAPAASGAVVTVASNQKLGQVLADSQGRTLYFFAKDSPGTSTCTGDCATTWPPLTSPVASPALPSGVLGELAVISRPDGTKQVAYDGMPLYYYAKDANPGDTNGEGVGKVWWVVTPAAALSTPTPSSG
jgi:predicted lipoprotein with Yx(FWY)xxD motif